jgi:hypothetical protein
VSAVARARYPRSSGPLPPPLPPETRTVGQLVAETLKLYGRRFWPSLALGLSLAAINQGSAGHRPLVQALVVCAGAPLLTLSLIGGSALASGVRPGRRRVLVAFAGGILVFLPAPWLSLGYALPAVAWLALVGLYVPVVVVEGIGFRAGIRRAVALSRADYVHALASLATLLIVFVLSRVVLVLLLHNQSDTAQRTAAFLADLVISPILFLGTGLLYVDQAARALRSRRPGRRRHANVHSPDQPDGRRAQDAEVESRPAAGSQP